MKRKSNHAALKRWKSPAGTNAAFVADGYERLVSGVESEARRIIEAKYADEWNASGLMHRWRLQRKIDAEVGILAARLMSDVSPEAMF